MILKSVHAYVNLSQSLPQLMHILIHSTTHSLTHHLLFNISPEVCTAAVTSAGFSVMMHASHGPSLQSSIPAQCFNCLLELLSLAKQPSDAEYHKTNVRLTVPRLLTGCSGACPFHVRLIYDCTAAFLQDKGEGGSQAEAAAADAPTRVTRASSRSRASSAAADVCLSHTCSIHSFSHSFILCPFL